MNGMQQTTKQVHTNWRKAVRWLLFLLLWLSLAFASYITFKPEYEYKPGWYENHFDKIHKDLNKVRSALTEFRKRHGRYPSNDEGLIAVKDLSKPVDPEDITLRVSLSRRYPSNELLKSAAGPLSAWEVPFVYENRRGIDPEKFAHSPVEEDHAGRYSLEVDDGIYIYSVGGWELSREYDGFLTKMYLEIWGTRSLFLVLLIIYLIFSYRSRAKKVQQIWFTATKVAAKILLLLLSFFTGMASGSVTCYIMMYFDREKRPNLTAKYCTLLEKYKERGIIKEEAYQTLLETLKQEQKALDEIRED